MKLLFILASGAVTGGNRVLLEWAERLPEYGHSCELMIWNQSHPRFNQFNGLAIRCEPPSVECFQAFDLLLFSNAFLLPEILPFTHIERAVLVCQSFESFCYGDTLDQVQARKPAIENILQLPVHRIAISQSVQRELTERLNAPATVVAPAINNEVFAKHKKQPGTNVVTERESIQGAERRRRVLFVGDYLWPLKGAADLIEALNIVNDTVPVELIVLTQQNKARHTFQRLSYPVEFHTLNDEKEIAALYSACDLYCCASWYEGFGLPVLEAWAAAVPAVSTRHPGVSNYGIDGQNLLLADINNPIDLAKKIIEVCSNEKLADSLADNGAHSVMSYSWERSTRECDAALREFAGQQPVGVQSKQEDVAIDAQFYAQLLLALERQGYYAPLSAHQRLGFISQEFERTIKAVKSGKLTGAEMTAALLQVKELLEKALSSNQTLLQDQLKPRLDLCRLLLAVSDTPALLTSILETHDKR